MFRFVAYWQSEMKLKKNVNEISSRRGETIETKKSHHLSIISIVYNIGLILIRSIAMQHNILVNLI